MEFAISGIKLLRPQSPLIFHLDHEQGWSQALVGLWTEVHDAFLRCRWNKNPSFRRACTNSSIGRIERMIWEGSPTGSLTGCEITPNSSNLHKTMLPATCLAGFSVRSPILTACMPHTGACAGAPRACSLQRLLEQRNRPKSLLLRLLRVVLTSIGIDPGITENPGKIAASVGPIGNSATAEVLLIAQPKDHVDLSCTHPEHSRYRRAISPRRVPSRPPCAPLPADIGAVGRKDENAAFSTNASMRCCALSKSSRLPLQSTRPSEGSRVRSKSQPRRSIGSSCPTNRCGPEYRGNRPAR